jgi:hypothetical protein
MINMKNHVLMTITPYTRIIIETCNNVRDEHDGREEADIEGGVVMNSVFWLDD